MLNNKALRWLIGMVYVILFIWMWMHSKAPTLQDIPVVFGAGLIVSLLCLVPFGNKRVNKVLTVINVVLLITNIVMYFAAYRLVSSTFKT